jgi:hypothetical protein
METKKQGWDIYRDDKIVVIRGAISWDSANFLLNYLSVKRKVAQRFLSDGYESELIGTFEETDTDKSVYSIYGDIAIDTAMLKVKPQVDKLIGEQTWPTYSYARIYPYESIVAPHKDREECEISCSMYLGGTKWDMFVEGKDGPERIDLNAGDMVVYAGTELTHWRETFLGVDSDGNPGECTQVSFHYQRANNQNFNAFDGRNQIGLPISYSKEK